MCAVFSISLCKFIDGRGTLLDPPSRGSRMKNQLFVEDMKGDCGGFYDLWMVHDGECGVCGDAYGDAKPRKHESGGTFGRGRIVKTYNSESMINITVKITKNQLGTFTFGICSLDLDHLEDDECFKKHPIYPASLRHYQLNPSTLAGKINITIQLPKFFKCVRCVLRWTYYTADKLGICMDDTKQIGCGQQDQFRSCSDISLI